MKASKKNVFIFLIILALLILVAIFGIGDQVKKVQDYITEHYYTCTKEILYGLGRMYAGGGDFTTNINKYGGEGTAEFAAAAIEIHCGR